MADVGDYSNGVVASSPFADVRDFGARTRVDRSKALQASLLGWSRRSCASVHAAIAPVSI